MYYPCSENKGADQLRGHREADLRLCFRLCKLLVFSCTGSYIDGKNTTTLHKILLNNATATELRLIKGRDFIIENKTKIPFK